MKVTKYFINGNRIWRSPYTNYILSSFKIYVATTNLDQGFVYILTKAIKI
jgi:hypothetical protein